MKHSAPLTWLWSEIEILLGPEQTAAPRTGFQAREREYARRVRIDTFKRELPHLETQLRAVEQRHVPDAHAVRSPRERINYRKMIRATEQEARDG